MPQPSLDKYFPPSITFISLTRLGAPDGQAALPDGNVEKSRQRRSLASHRHGRHFAVLTYKVYAPRVKKAAAFPSTLLRTGLAELF